MNDHGRSAGHPHGADEAEPPAESDAARPRAEDGEDTDVFPWLGVDGETDAESAGGPGDGDREDTAVLSREEVGAGPAWGSPAPGGPGGPGGPGSHAWTPSGPGGPAPYGAWGSPPPRRDAGRVPGWLWPAVAALALVVGLVGGALGGAAWTTVSRLAESGTSSSGMEDVDTISEPPLPEGGSVASVAQRLLPSTVQIRARGGQQGGATGSGFVLDRQGHVVTNNHVVAGSTESGTIRVVDQDGNEATARLVGRSPVYDLAVLEVEDLDGLRPASLGRADSLVVGQDVVAIGSPLGLSSTVTAGIVSALDRPVTTGNSEDESSYINAVQTDAAINPGNSGGPLVDLRGQVVGVNSAIATTGGFGAEAGNIGVGFAIPIEQVRTTADQILRTGEARYPVIGATVQTGGDAQEDGAVVQEVGSGTPAASAGLEGGDLITEVDGQRVMDGIALIVAIRTYQPGETIELTVLRDGQESTLEVTLAGRVG
jgi:putative serine protease PepD